jgi:hypothetical protein
MTQGHRYIRVYCTQRKRHGAKEKVLSYKKQHRNHRGRMRFSCNGLFDETFAVRNLTGYSSNDDFKRKTQGTDVKTRERQQIVPFGQYSILICDPLCYDLLQAARIYFDRKLEIWTIRLKSMRRQPKHQSRAKNSCSNLFHRMRDG